jgi:hypothetical protein
MYQLLGYPVNSVFNRLRELDEKPTMSREVSRFLTGRKRNGMHPTPSDIRRKLQGPPVSQSAVLGTAGP